MTGDHVRLPSEDSCEAGADPKAVREPMEGDQRLGVWDFWSGFNTRVTVQVQNIGNSLGDGLISGEDALEGN